MRPRYPAPEIGIGITTFEKVEDEISRVFWCRLFACEIAPPVICSFGILVRSLQ